MEAVNFLLNSWKKIPKVIQNDSNDILITTLKSEIEFLRNEILSKDKIIEMIIKEKPTRNQAEQNNDQIGLSNTSLNVKNVLRIQNFYVIK